MRRRPPVTLLVLIALSLLTLCLRPAEGRVKQRRGDVRPVRPYLVVGTGQQQCYDERGVIPVPGPGQAFHGQDAQHPGPGASYALGSGGRTVIDRNTGLTWQRSADTNGDGRLDSRDKLTFEQARTLPARLNAARFGGFNDWRLPNIKELYSLFDARGTDPSGPEMASSSGLRPFLDTKFFRFAYGDPSSVGMGGGPGGNERLIDAQYASSTQYTGWSAQGRGKVFGVNFADGRIKGYDLLGRNGEAKTFFVLCVRGNPQYGKNSFHDNGDGTVSDRATGLTWAKADSGAVLNWQQALAWVQQQNARKHLGHGDWRLPNIKELQSIVDYSRAPDATGSAAIDPVFSCTRIANEGGQPDFPYYWSSTTHANARGGNAAMYVAFGRALGWMTPSGGGPGHGHGMMGGPWLGMMGGGGFSGPPSGPGYGGPERMPGKPGGPPPGGIMPGRPVGTGALGPGAGVGSVEYRLLDIHGAGAQRSDPKAGNAADFPHGRGPQGDVLRIENYVRLVRGPGS